MLSALSRPCRRTSPSRKKTTEAEMASARLARNGRQLAWPPAWHRSSRQPGAHCARCVLPGAAVRCAVTSCKQSWAGCFLLLNSPQGHVAQSPKKDGYLAAVLAAAVGCLQTPTHFLAGPKQHWRSATTSGTSACAYDSAVGCIALCAGAVATGGERHGTDSIWITAGQGGRGRCAGLWEHGHVTAPMPHPSSTPYTMN